MYERIKGYYDKGLWSAAMVRQAADKGLLTVDQYRQIVDPELAAEQEVPENG